MKEPSRGTWPRANVAQNGNRNIDNVIFIGKHLVPIHLHVLVFTQALEFILVTG